MSFIKVCYIKAVYDVKKFVNNFLIKEKHNFLKNFKKFIFRKKL